MSYRADKQVINTHTLTDTQTGPLTIPEGQNWPRVKNNLSQKQETLLRPDQTQTFKHYSAYYKSGIHGHGSVCILLKNCFIHSEVLFKADLQAVAVCITINNKIYTVASVYIYTSETLNELAFDRMINSFSSRYLILDFNDHSHLWGANQENEHGKVVEKLIDSHNLILLNDSVHTWFDTYHQTSSLRDLSLYHPSIYMDVACEVLLDRSGSDHYPIIITTNTSDHPVSERVPKWNFKKAKWNAFQDHCIKEITPDLFHNADDKIAIFSSTLLDIETDNIPKTSIRLEGPEDCHLRNSSFGVHVTSLTLQYLWPRPPGVWLGGPGYKPGHSRRS